MGGARNGEPRDMDRRISDSVFTHMLKIPQFTRRFYTDQHPEDADITEGEIEIVTIENVLTNTIRNDLGFIARDRLLVLAEAQKKWSQNIPLRMMMYCVETIERRISDRKREIHGSKAVAIPRPELYMVYSGDRAQVPSTMTLSEMHFDGARADIDATVHVIQADGSHSLMDQFIRFSRIATDEAKRNGRGMASLLGLIERCKREDILTEYLDTRESEVASIMESMMSWECELEAMKMEGFEEGIIKGRAEGRTEGRTEGRAEGRAEGKHDLLSELLSAGVITRAIADKFMPKGYTPVADR